MTRIDSIRMDALDHATLCRLLYFDPISGIFTWLIDGRKRLNGSRAGWETSAGYRQIRVNRHVYMEHRLAWLFMTGAWPSCEIDHINGIGSDNRFVNLREATRFDNMQNRPIRADNRSGYPGVYFDKKRNRWRAEIHHHRKKMQIGMFDSLELAIFVREHVDAKLKGTFAPSHVKERMAS